MQTQETLSAALVHLKWLASLAALVTLPVSLAFAEGGGGGAIDGQGGSGPEPSALMLLGVATGVGALIALRRKGGDETTQAEEG